MQGATADSLTDAELTHLEKLAAAAAPAPWEAFLEEHGGLGGPSFIRVGGLDDAQPDMYVYRDRKPASAADIDFIAAARNAVPRLLAELRRLRAAR